MESEDKGGFHPMERPDFLNPKFIEWVESLPLQSEDGLWFQDHLRRLGHGRGKDKGREQ
jgi:hypothetical protein